MTERLERAQKRITGEVPMWGPTSLSALLDIKLTSAQPGLVSVEYEFNEQHKGLDALNVGVLCTMAEAVMNMAFAMTLSDEEFCNMIEMKINFMKPVRNGKLHATGKLLKGGRTLGLVECDILDDGQQLVAHAVGTSLKLENK